MKLVYNDAAHSYYLDGVRAKGVTSVAKMVSDSWAIDRWNDRMVAIGITIDTNLRENVATHLHDKQRMADICEDAKKAAKAHEAADRGTQMHRVLQLVLLDQEAKLVTDQQRRDAAVLRATLDRYRLRPYDGLVEQFVAYPQQKVCGQLDAVLQRPDGSLILVDLKGLALDTKLPTPSGWTTMATVAVGDQVFGSDGQSCTVTAKSAVKRIGTYVVTFDDGAQVICDREHAWWTTNNADRQRARRHGTDAVPSPRPIEDVVATLKCGVRSQHWVPIAGPLDLPDADPPIDPYLLGVWLGDGRVRSGNITKEDALFDILESDGHQLGIRYDKSGTTAPCRTVLGLTKQLRLTGLQHNKHVPDLYLRASHHQRLRLLQGLMDTDGTWNIKRQSAVFNSTDKTLALAAEELLLTLGQRPHVAEFQASGYGKTVTAYAVEFTPRGIEPFRLPRKAEKATQTTKSLAYSSRRLIVSIEPGPDVETACIAVDSPDNTYLCSERMIPTHNSGPNAVAYPQSTAAQLAMYRNAPLISDHVRGQVSSSKETVTKWRQMPQGLDSKHGYVLLVPPDADVGTLYELDIAHGWAGAQLALGLVMWRKEFNGGRDIAVEVSDTADPWFEPPVGLTFIEQAATATNLVTLRTLWDAARHAGALDEQFKAVAIIRAQELWTGVREAAGTLPA